MTMTQKLSLTNTEEAALLKLANRLAQAISPLDRNLEVQVINIVDSLKDAFSLGFESGLEYAELIQGL